LGSTPRLEQLRAAGFDDAAILRATEIVGYFNFVNRLANGLGVELESST
jgi:alkylhydroperoxidase family enzyme